MVAIDMKHKRIYQSVNAIKIHIYNLLKSE